MNVVLQELLENWDRLEVKFRATMAKHGTWEGGKYQAYRNVTKEQAHKLLEFVKNIQDQQAKLGNKIEMFCEEHNKATKSLNSRTLKTRKMLLQHQKEGINIPEGIKQLYRLNEDLDESEYL